MKYDWNQTMIADKGHTNITFARKNVELIKILSTFKHEMDLSLTYQLYFQNLYFFGVVDIKFISVLFLKNL
jgi:hypothetical protein